MRHREQHRPPFPVAQRKGAPALGDPEQRCQRSLAGSVAFAGGILLVLATATLGAYAGVVLLGRVVDAAPLSTLVPGDGHNALVIGGIAIGAVTGLMLPLILFGMVRGSRETPRVGPGAAARKVLAVFVFDLYLLLVAMVVAQLGWILPEGILTLVGVFAIGFSWMPLAMVPWEKFGLGAPIGNRRTPPRPSGSPQPE
ncbi:hypothetical protein ACIHCM_15040 [Streptomyces sp. NPDC052023]|uniref:hypothetical protein n=1 Tax=Streptomyces sp. NPDC052023 TaxID=3365681 RepID=UPI0037D4141C